MHGTLSITPRWKLGSASERRLATCDERLQRVVRMVVACSMTDITVLEGHRTLARQQALYRQGASKLDGMSRKGKHQYSPSLAVDVAPYPIDWQDHRRFYLLAGCMMSCAHMQGITLRWGGNWDGDESLTDQSFFDLPHFELVG